MKPLSQALRRPTKFSRAQARWAPQVPRLRVSMALDVTKLDLRSGAVPAASSFQQQAGTVAWPPGAASGSVTLQLLNSGNLTVRADPQPLPEWRWTMQAGNSLAASN